MSISYHQVLSRCTPQGCRSERSKPSWWALIGMKTFLSNAPWEIRIITCILHMYIGMRALIFMRGRRIVLSHYNIYHKHLWMRRGRRIPNPFRLERSFNIPAFLTLRVLNCRQIYWYDYPFKCVQSKLEMYKYMSETVHILVSFSLYVYIHIYKDLYIWNLLCRFIYLGNILGQRGRNICSSL